MKRMIAGLVFVAITVLLLPMQARAGWNISVQVPGVVYAPPPEVVYAPPPPPPVMVYPAPVYPTYGYAYPTYGSGCWPPGHCKGFYGSRWAYYDDDWRHYRHH